MNLPPEEKEKACYLVDTYNPELLFITGSRAYGIHKEGSDFDYRGFCMPEVTHILGTGAFHNRFDQHDLTTTHNATIYNIQKFIKLALDNNPNVIEFLYISADSIIIATDVYYKLRGKRSLFLSQKAFHTFRGYAHAQKNRMQKLDENINQNKSRLDLFYKYGYDCKNFMHTMRLQKSLLDILDKNTFIVDRTGIDADFLKECRQGKYTKFEALDMIEELDQQIIKAKETTTLQHHADLKGIDLLTQEIMWEFLCKEKKY